MPYVVFIAAPDFDTLKAMHKAVVDAGITTKQLTVGLKKMKKIRHLIEHSKNHIYTQTGRKLT